MSGAEKESFGFLKERNAKNFIFAPLTKTTCGHSLLAQDFVYRIIKVLVIELTGTFCFEVYSVEDFQRRKAKGNAGCGSGNA